MSNFLMGFLAVCLTGGILALPHIGNWIERRRIHQKQMHDELVAIFYNTIKILILAGDFDRVTDDNLYAVVRILDPLGVLSRHRQALIRQLDYYVQHYSEPSRPVAIWQLEKALAILEGRVWDF